MPRLLFLLGLVLGHAAGLIAAESASRERVTDPATLLMPEARAHLTEKLAALEQQSGWPMLVRFHPASPSAEEDKEPGAYMRALATKLGTSKAGVLAVYFADEEDWRVWIGDDLTPRFVGRAGTAAEFTESGAMHDAKEAFLKDVFARAEQAFKTTPEKTRLTESQARALRRALQAEELVEGLRVKLGKP